jgi:hypothetical protein
VIVAKPGSSNVVTVNGLPSTQVSVLFGLHVTDNLGNVIIDFRKPGTSPCRHAETGAGRRVGQLRPRPSSLRSGIHRQTHGGRGVNLPRPRNGSEWSKVRPFFGRCRLYETLGFSPAADQQGLDEARRSGMAR